METLQKLLEAATTRHRAGELTEALDLYAQVLAIDPAHPLAHFRSGLLHLQTGNPQAALLAVARAAAAAPDESSFQAGLGQVLQSLRRWDEAAQAYQRALRLAPGSADLQFALGSVLQLAGNIQLAITAYAAAVQLQPDMPDAWNNLGVCRQRDGDLAGAATAYRQALGQRPGDVTVTTNLGAVLRDLGQLQQAIELLNGVLSVQPEHVPSRVNLAIALCQQRRFAAAAGVLQRALELAPDDADVQFNAALALHGLGRNVEAAQHYRQAAALRPDYAEAFNNLGNVLTELGEFSAAQTAFEAALRARPGYLITVNNLAGLLRTLGRSDAAEDLLREGLAIDPKHAGLLDTLGNVLKDAGALHAALQCFRASLALDLGREVTHSNLVYTLSFEALDGLSLRRECELWDEKFAAPLRVVAGGAAGLPKTEHRSQSRRLKIGYVSPDFREHCQSLFTLPLLSNHDHARFEIHCYSSVVRPDALTQRLAACADVWREVRTLEDADLAEVIRADGVDILVDLTMHMARGRPLLFVRRPAPLQVAWLAYPGTTGNRDMDYRFSDPRLDPPDFDAHYTERTLRLPDSFWCYDPLTQDVEVKPLPALQRGRITFGCLNNPCKLTPRTLCLWGEVLRAMPTARLLLLAPEGRHRQRLRERLEAEGISAARIQLVAQRPRAEYLRLYHEIDLCLDTFPYNGHTTSLDALWMGVPTITRVGQTSVGRAGLSQLFQLGLTELAAESDQEFVAKAIAVGTDVARLAALRAGLRTAMRQSPLMDGARFARAVEAAYLGMWNDANRDAATGPAMH